MIVTDEMVLAAARTLIRYILAERDRVKPEAVTEEEIDDEFAEIRQLEAESPELPGVEEAFTAVLTAALGVSGGAVTRKPSDIWQAVLVDYDRYEVGLDVLADADAVMVRIVRRSAAIRSDDGRRLPGSYDVMDVAYAFSDFDDDEEVRTRYAWAQAMAAGLNAAEATR